MEKEKRWNVVQFSHSLVIIGSIVLILSISAQALDLFDWFNDQHFLVIQLILSMLFMADYWIEFAYSKKRWRYLGRRFFFLLVSIPYLNLTHWFNPHISQNMYNLLALVPLIRAGYGMVLIIEWISRNKVTGLMLSYIVLVCLYTYVSALIFFSIEQHINPSLHTFGDALFWAAMNVTTVGANYFAVTTLGKIITVTLPALGMMMFPIFTLYVTDRFKRIKKR